MAGRSIVEIMKSMKEYTKEKINDCHSIKPEITELLKTHRPIKLSDFEYGISSCLAKKDHRLIIKEENDKSKVREYLKSQNYWYCSNVKSKSHKCHSSSLKFKYGILFAPIKHSKECALNKYKFAMEIQEVLKQGKRLSNFKRKSLINASALSSSTSIVNESNLSTIDMENDSILDQSVVDETTENIVSNITLPDSETSTLTAIEIVPESSRPCAKRESDDTEYCMIIVEPPAKKPKLESNNAETFSFDLPPASKLRKVCEKLNIKYANNVFKFWGDINFDKVVSISENIKTHSICSTNVFTCFSQLFTGKIDKCYFLQDVINTAFRDDLIASGTASPEEIDEIFINPTVSEQQLEFIAKFLSCRIGIFENGILKKFGKWETENNDALTLILSLKNGFYDVVLDL